MKKTISKKENKKEFVTHLELCTRQSCLAHTHLSQGLAPPILTPMSLWYLASYFSLAFLKGWQSLLSPRMTSLCLYSVIWDFSAPFKKTASSASTLSQSCWKYSNVFFFSSSAILLFLASSLTFASAFFLAFWATCSAQHSFATSSNWARSYCFSSCLHCFSCCCSSSISVSFWKMLEWRGKDMVIQKKR